MNAIAETRLLPAAPRHTRALRQIFGVPLSGSAWVDLFSWACGTKSADLIQAISVVLDEITRLEVETQRQLGSEWTQDAIDAVWKVVRMNTGAAKDGRE